VGEDPISEFVMVHGDCGPIDVKYTTDLVSLRCAVCGATRSVTAEDNPGAVADTIELLDLAACANFSAADREVLADPRSTAEDITQVLSAYPALQRVLDRVFGRQGQPSVAH
jgi:hypothetical protein